MMSSQLMDWLAFLYDVDRLLYELVMELDKSTGEMPRYHRDWCYWRE